MNLETMRAKAELLRVQSAKAEMELNIFERKAEIERLEQNVLKQNERIKEIEAKLNNLQGE